MKTDVRTNKLIITDTLEKIMEVGKLIATIDGKPRQVLIEAKMIQIQLNESYYLGVDWQKVFSSRSQWRGVTLVGKYPFPSAIQPKPGSTFSATIGTIPPDSFSATVNALSQFGNLKTISSPRLVALNDMLAKFMVGSREAYVTTTVTTTQGGQSVAENVQFLDVGITLSVTPTINADGFITMHLGPEISAVYDRITTSQGNVVPLVQTTNVNVDVVVKDSVTIVIAGLIRDEKRITNAGIPLMKDIPLLGPLFRQSGEAQIKTETVIFLTPYIISGDADDSQFTKERELEKKDPINIREIR
jgi:type II secretory pathway component GspD/PulD (secretin)